MGDEVTPDAMLQTIRAVNGSAAFNTWAGIEVLSAGNGEARIALAWQPEFGQYSGFLHAGLVGALIDTVCGFAAATVAGRVLASHYAVNCLRPAVGARFVARARVLRAGRVQVFAAAELHAWTDGGDEVLVATGDALLVPAAEAAPPSTP